MVLPTFQGRPPIYQETLRSPGLGTTFECLLPGTKPPATHQRALPAGERLDWVAPGAWRTAVSISSRTNDASCTSKDGAADVKPEAARGVQEGGNSSPQGPTAPRAKENTARPAAVMAMT